jgi:hypothetical protein
MPGPDQPAKPLNEVVKHCGLSGTCRCRPVVYGRELGFFDLECGSSVKVSVMTQAKRCRAQARTKSDCETPDEFELSNLRAGPSVSGRSSNEANTRLCFPWRVVH